MKLLGSILLIGLTFLVGCHAQIAAEGCSIEGPEHLLPADIKRVHLGMSASELQDVLGEAAYSPIEGQYYFSTGGDCPLEGAERVAPCGLVADFRDYDSGNESVLSGSLQSCWWGAIAE